MSKEHIHEFNGDVSLEEIYEDNKELIYSNIVSSMEKSLKIDPEVSRIEAMEFKKNGTVFTIDIKRSQFKSVLNSALEYFLSVEDYKKCTRCKNLIDKLQF